MEPVDGGTLTQRVNGRPQDATSAARLLETLARAMHHAHQQGIIHRDLKPANILLGSSDPKTRGATEALARAESRSELDPLRSAIPKIADFGLAKRVDDVQQTQRGLVVGTLSYMAPEQASWRGRQVTPAVDVYSLGAILYELLTGRAPFGGESWSEILQQVEREDPVPPRRLQPRVPLDLETICLNCLQKKPERRYAGAGSLADDLRRFLEGEPIRARPTPAWEHTWKWARRRPAVAGLSTAVVLAVALGVVLVTWQWRQAVANEGAAVAARREVERLLTSATVDRAIVLCERGDVDHGLLWLARGLEMATTVGDPDLERVARTNLTAWRQVHVRPLVTLPHAGGPSTMVFTRDGRLAFAASGDRTVQRWAIPSGRAVGRPLELALSIQDLALSPDERLLAIGGGTQEDGPGYVQFWDVAKGQPIGPSQATEGVVRRVSFSPDGRRLLLLHGRTAAVWPVPGFATATAERAGRLVLAHPGDVLTAEVSPDGRTAITGGADGTARFWDVATGSPLGAPLGHAGPVEGAVFSPDGKSLVTAFVRPRDAGASVVRGGARLWDVRTRRAVGEILEHPARVVALVFSPDGRGLLTGGTAPPDSADPRYETGEVRLWDTATALPIGPPLRYPRAVGAAAFHPDGRSIVTSSADGTLRFLEAATGQPIGTPLLRAGDVRALRFSPDGQYVLSGPAKSDPIWLCKAPAGRVDGSPLRHGTRVYSLRLSPDGTTAAIGGPDGEARLWDVASRRPVGVPMAHGAVVHAVCFTPDGRFILTSGVDGRTRTWDAATGRPAGRPIRHPFSVRCATLSPDGSLLVVGGQTFHEPLTGSLQCWDWAAARAAGPVMVHPGCANSVAFHPNGQLVLSGGDEGVRVWEAASGRLLRSYSVGERIVHGLALTPDGRTYGTGGDNNRAQLWHFDTGRPSGPFLPHLGAVQPVAFSPDGRMFLTGSNDRTARLWDAATGKPLGPPMPHGDRVTEVTFSPTGRTMVTGGIDRLVLFWDVPAPLGGGPEEVIREVERWTDLRLNRDGTVVGLDAGPSQSDGAGTTTDRTGTRFAESSN